MDRPRSILRVGLTGGIASGKTTVAHMLAEHGAFIVNADEIAHEVIEPGGPAFDAVVSRFGEEILDDRGRIDRGRLGRRVFRDSAEREALNALVHPAVIAETERRLEAYVPEGGHSTIAVYDAALLIETGRHRDFDKLIVVRCCRDSQIRRMLARDGITPEDAARRIDAQLPLERKLEVADYVIDTDGTLRDTQLQTDRVFTSLVQDFESLFGPPAC